MPRRWLLLVLFALVPQLASGAERRRASTRLRASTVGTDRRRRALAARRPPGARCMVFAGSATLAKQLAAGAPADVFVSADATWMDELAARERIDRESRVDLLGNAVVLVAPRDAGFEVELRRGFPLAAGVFRPAVHGRARRRARSAPVRARSAAVRSAPGTTCGAHRRHGRRRARRSRSWSAGNVRRASSTRPTRRSSARVGRSRASPTSSHRPMVYPAALLQRAGPEGRAFFAFLRDSPEVAALFSERHGFARAANESVDAC